LLVLLVALVLGIGATFEVASTVSGAAAVWVLVLVGVEWLVAGCLIAALVVESVG
jgi:hypothetical protein